MNVKEYISTEAQLHVASQVISLTGKNLVDKRADDSHTTAIWDSEKQLIIGREFNLNDNTFSIFIDPIDFALGLIKNDSETERISLDGLTYMQTVEPWKKWLSEAGFNGELDLSLHYELPSSDLYIFDAFAKPSDYILGQWAKNRTMANSLFKKLSTMVNSASDINIWPHHFDSGVYYELHRTEGATDRSIGAGFNPADGMVDQPYFYIYAWYKDKKLDYSDKHVLTNGKWILNNWEGAVLPISEVADYKTIESFYKTTSSYLKNKLS